MVAQGESDLSELAELLVQDEPAANYASVENSPELAGAEVDRLIRKGFAIFYKDWDAVVADFGKVLVSKLACIIKARADGTLRVRDVLDLRRSGFNKHVRQQERVVLPRLKDLVADGLALMDGDKEGNGGLHAGGRL